jgi:hypothetical protein
VTREELMSLIMLDVSRIYELFDEFIEDQRDLGFNDGIEEVVRNPEQYGLTRVDQ